MAKKPAKKNYDPTVVRVAGNLLSGIIGHDRISDELIASAAKTAWKIVRAVRKATPKNDK